MFQPNFNGLRKRETYDEIIDYLQNDQEIIRYPDRFARRIREHPYLTQLDGEGLMEMEDQQAEREKQLEREHQMRKIANASGTSASNVRAQAQQFNIGTPAQTIAPASSSAAAASSAPPMSLPVSMEEELRGVQLVLDEQDEEARKRRREGVVAEAVRHFEHLSSLQHAPFVSISHLAHQGAAAAAAAAGAEDDSWSRSRTRNTVSSKSMGSGRGMAVEDAEMIQDEGPRSRARTRSEFSNIGRGRGQEGNGKGKSSPQVKALPSPQQEASSSSAAAAASEPAPQPASSSGEGKGIGVKKTHTKEASKPKNIPPSRMGIQNLSEAFETAINRKQIDAEGHARWELLFDRYRNSAGNPDRKKKLIKDMQHLFKDKLYKK